MLIMGDGNIKVEESRTEGDRRIEEKVEHKVMRVMSMRVCTHGYEQLNGYVRSGNRVYMIMFAGWVGCIPTGTS